MTASNAVSIVAWRLLYLVAWAGVGFLTLPFLLPSLPSSEILVTLDNNNELGMVVLLSSFAFFVAFLVLFFFLPCRSADTTTTAKHNGGGSTALMTTTPKSTLDLIPRLLLVDIQEDDANYVCSALQCLFEAFTDGNAKDGIRLGAPALLMLIMKKFSFHEEIQCWCCACLGRLSYCNKNNNDYGAHWAIAKSGCLETIMNAMKSFPHSDTLQVNACCTLMNLFGSTKLTFDEVKEIAYHFVDELDGLQIVKKAMEEFPNEIRLQAACCGILMYLSSRLPEFCDVLIETGLVSPVGMAIKNHGYDSSGDERVQKFGQRFMRNLFIVGRGDRTVTFAS